MKRSIALLLLAFTAASAHAGSLFGPPPFNNGSSLVTGVDGSYQASARATNVTGVFRFQYSNGVQTGTISKNNWVFFVNGSIKRGSCSANINNSTVDGVLDSLTAGTNTNGGTALPIYIISDSCSGEFNGKMNPNGAFSGKGLLKAAAAGVTSMTIVSQDSIVTTNGTSLGPITSTNVSWTNAAGFDPVNFKFSGVRASLGSSTSTN